MPQRLPVAAVALAAVALLATACSAGVTPAANSGPAGVIVAVGAENTYASVISQIGGRYVRVTAIESNPNTDPHSFEASPSVASVVSSARLVVQNGLGYDSYMDKIEAAAPSPDRKVINVQHLLGLPDSTSNPHLWYSPRTMPAVAKELVRELSAIQPQHAAYFRANEQRFERSLQRWLDAIGQFKQAYPGTPVATTEPVADYTLQAAGTDNLTPAAFQDDVMNGVDPAPQLVELQNQLISGRKVKAFLYNRQVTDNLTESFLSRARAAGVPVVAVYETMPAGYTYQSWMLAEVQALRRAVAQQASTEQLGH
ncbi:MAG TPA: zinc ABC transporter substrate-binding protein [Streptosporangiaceae bacterium]|jgi:zinc/manganese transport system substrate-binding protein